jgi:hypothetical protein
MSDRTKIIALTELMEALTNSIGSITGLIQDSGNPTGLFIIRDALTLTKEGLLGVAAASGIIAKTKH